MPDIGYKKIRSGGTMLITGTEDQESEEFVDVNIGKVIEQEGIKGSLGMDFKVVIPNSVA